MKKSYILLSFSLFLCLNQGVVQGATIQPIERTVGKLHISIDPRMELLSTIQLLSNYRVINRNLPYSKEIIGYFESFSTQEAVKLTDSLVQKFGFSYDAPVVFMLHLSQPSELVERVKFSDYVLERSGGSDNLEKYRKSIKQFSEISKFEDFWNSKIPFYNQILDMTVADMQEKDLVTILENYYNETQGSYNIIILPAVGGGGFGPRIPGTDGKYDIYNCVSTTNIKDGIPYLDWNNLIHYVWHEFGHSFVNPLTDKYANKVATIDKLFEPIKDVMSRQAYSSWYFCLNEHIIRAIHIRLEEQYLDIHESIASLNRELGNRFIYIEPLIEKLKDFEKQRDEKNITFSEFYPELLNVLDSLQKIEYWKQKMNFIGPIRGVLSEEKLAIIYSTQDFDTEALQIVQDYALTVFNTYAKSRGGIFLADTTALKTDLSECGIIAIGTIESNLFLKQHTHTFPFRIENQTICADKEYTDKEIKLIACVPNPNNPERGMIIYTALSNRVIQDYANIFYSNIDYGLFLNLETVISYGFYNKIGKWTF